MDLLGEYAFQLQPRIIHDKCLKVHNSQLGVNCKKTVFAEKV